MATMKVADLDKGGIYREPLSGFYVRVRRIIVGAGGPHQAEVFYYNPVTGRFIEFTVYDHELEESPKKRA